MKNTLLSALLTLLTGSLIAADSNPKNEVTAAAKKLGEKANYSWKQTIVVPESAPFKPGPSEGKLEKDGVTFFTLSFDVNSTQIYLKGDKSAIHGPDGGWQSAKDLEGDEGPGRFLGFIIKSFKAPSAQATELADAVKELKKDGDAYFGDLTEAGAKAQFRFGNPTDPKGSVKFWIKDGQLTKFESKLTGKVDFGGNEVDVDRTTTIEIKDVGTTKVEVPAEARKKLEPAPAPADPAPSAK